MPEIQIYSPAGERLYLTPDERQAFFEASATAAPHEARTLCRCLYYTGCRISEALELTRDRVDLGARVLTFRSLKKRGKTHWRSVPVPDTFLDELDLVHKLRDGRKVAPDRLWPIGRTTAWTRVKEVLAAASVDLSKPYAVPKGLRHGFGVSSILKGVPLPVLQRWMGHASIETTAIYLQVVGEEERELAAKNWG